MTNITTPVPKLTSFTNFWQKLSSLIIIIYRLFPRDEGKH